MTITEEQVRNALPDAEILDVFFGVLHDPRNTDNAWIETSAYNYHDEKGVMQHIDLPGPGSDGESPLHWLTISSTCNICEEQLELLKRVAALHAAYFAPKRRKHHENVRRICTAISRTSNVPFGISLGTTNKGQHVITTVQENSLAATHNIKPMDVLYQVDNQNVTGWAHEDVKQYLQSHASVVLTVERRLSRMRANTVESWRRQFDPEDALAAGRKKAHRRRAARPSTPHASPAESIPKFARHGPGSRPAASDPRPQ